MTTNTHVLMTPAEVAAAFRVSSRTVSRWADDGLLPTIRTLGGHRRFRRDAVQAALAELDSPVPYEVVDASGPAVSSTAGLASLRAGATHTTDPRPKGGTR